MLCWWFYIKRNSVKDKDNLAPHNVWSGGDYSHDFTGFTLMGQDDNNFTELDNTHPTNGEYNIKLTRINESPYYYNIQYVYTVNSEDYGKTATLTADITSNLNNSAVLMIRSSGKQTTTTIPVNSQSTFSVSYAITEDNAKLECLIPTFPGNTTGSVYIDNIHLNIQ